MSILLGPCCVCGNGNTVKHIVLLNQRGITPGRGWGCLVCDLPPDGAVAVVCKACLGQPLRFACRGYPNDPGRVAISELPPGEFAHDETRHALEERAHA